MNRLKLNDVYKTIHKRYDVPPEVSKHIVRATHEIIAEALQEPDTIVTISPIGTLESYTAKPRKGRDKRTGEPIDIPAKVRVRLLRYPTAEPPPQEHSGPAPKQDATRSCPPFD